MSENLFGVAQRNQTKNTTIFIIKVNTGARKSFFSIKYPILNMKLYLKFSLLRRFFQVILTSPYSLSQISRSMTS